MANQEPPSLANNFYLKPLDENTNHLAYNNNFIDIKSVEPSLGIPSANTHTNPTSTYYFPVIEASATTYSDSRKFTNGNDGIVYKNDNLGIGTNNPNKKLTVVGSISGNENIIIGQNNSSISNNSSVLGGQNNIIKGDYSFIGGGTNNVTLSSYSYIGGGFYNQVNNTSGLIFGGTQNIINGNASNINGGGHNTINGASSNINGGTYNVINDDYSVISGGFSNTSYGNYTGIFGGTNNYISATNSYIIGSNINVQNIDDTTFVENLNVLSSAKINGDLSIFGNLSAFTSSVNNTNFNETSALIIYNDGVGPALDVTQHFSNYDIAVFKGNQGSQVLHIGNTPVNPIDGTTGFVGINTSNPNVELTVNGSISSNNSIYGNFHGTFYGDSSNLITNLFPYTSGIGLSSIQPILGDNIASGNYSVIGGGYKNQALGNTSNIVGGYNNIIATSDTNGAGLGGSNILGGWGNCICLNTLHTIAGGEQNCIGLNATTYSFIGGGGGNLVDSDNSSIVGGINNKIDITSYASFIGSGCCNTVSCCGTSVVGGWCNTACGSFSFIGGGSCNTASGYYYQFIGGGSYNKTQSNHSSAVGGQGNTSSGMYSTVVGGRFNTACGDFSYIGGGCGNLSGHYASNVSSGHVNQAIGCVSTIGGGAYNSVSGYASTISGGYGNTLDSNCSVIVGGYHNCSNYSGGNYADYSFIGGGSCNTTNQPYSIVVGGYGNTASGYYSTVVGGGGYANIPQPIISNLVSYFKLDSYSNYPSLDDSAQPGNYLTYSGDNSISLGSGIINDGATLDAINGSFLTYNSNNTIANNATVSMWLSGDGGFLEIITTAIYSNNIGVYKNSINQGGTKYVGSPNIWGFNGFNNWFHLVVVINNREVKTYINGDPVDTQNSNGDSFQFQQINFGKFEGDYFTGTMDEISIWNKSLTQQEVLSLYNNGSGLSYDNIINIQNAPVPNNASGNYSTIIGGINNNTNGKENTHILGSNITASSANYTYVNALSSQGRLHGSCLSVGNITNSAVGNTTSSKFAIYDASGNLIGYVPIYES